MSSQNHPARRLLHASDLHILTPGDRGCRALAALIGLAQAQQVHLLLIAGDLFDQNRIEDATLESVREQFLHLNIPVVILPGNHDWLSEDSVYHNIHWQNTPGVFIFRNPGGETLTFPDINLSIWGKPIATYFDVRPLAGMPVPAVDGGWNIAAAHGLVVQQIPRHARSYLITEAEIDGTGWDYIALGHITIYERVREQPLTVYSGSATERGSAALVDFAETGVNVTRCDIMKDSI